MPALWITTSYGPRRFAEPAAIWMPATTERSPTATPAAPGTDSIA